MIITTKITQYDENGNILSENLITEEVFFKVTNSNLRRILIEKGLFNTIDTSIKNSGNQDLIALWEYANYIDPDNPYVLQFKQSLGMTDEEFQDIFLSALFLE